MKETIIFPKDFLWGSATAAEQIEQNGLNDFRDGRAPTIWDKWFETDNYRFFDGEFSQNDFYNKFKEDIKAANDIGLKSLRLSISWSRLLPDGKNINQKAVDFYRAVFSELKKYDMKIFVCLHHADLPLRISDNGGWANKETITEFTEFSLIAFKLFNDQVDYWFTFNEPNGEIWDAYWFNLQWPNKLDLTQGIVALWNMVVAHHRVLKEYRKFENQKPIGIILNPCIAIPRSEDPSDIEAAEMANLFQWKCFFDPIMIGKFPQKFIDEMDAKGFWPKNDILEEEINLFKENKIDILGINYYHPQRIKAPSSLKNWKGAVQPTHWFEEYDMPGKRMNKYRGWEINPKVLYKLLMQCKNDYPDTILFVSENGMGVEGEDQFRNEAGVIQDDYRIDFLTEHIYWMHKAIEDGANIIGYHMWTYIDNWSWMNAYKNRYGFIELDLKTNTRKLKKSAGWMKELSRTNQLEVDTTYYQN